MNIDISSLPPFQRLSVLIALGQTINWQEYATLPKVQQDTLLHLLLQTNDPNGIADALSNASHQRNFHLWFRENYKLPQGLDLEHMNAIAEALSDASIEKKSAVLEIFTKHAFEHNKPDVLAWWYAQDMTKDVMLSNFHSHHREYVGNGVEKAFGDQDYEVVQEGVRLLHKRFAVRPCSLKREFPQAFVVYERELIAQEISQTIAVSKPRVM